jgi:hypothetical protein
MLIVKAFNVVAREGLIMTLRKSFIRYNLQLKKTKSRNPPDYRVYSKLASKRKLVVGYQKIPNVGKVDNNPLFKDLVQEY